MIDTGWTGQTLGDRYQIQELLGEGGMSAVYKAYDPNLRRVVAVKLIHSHLSRNPKFVRRFGEEAAAVAKLRHENIIQVFDFNNEGSTYYIVFEFVPGESLRERLVRLSKSLRKLSVFDITSYSASIADALQYAHKRGLIHRDVKPANVMISVQGQAILTDFGIVKIVGGDTHTATGAVMGTARYISPEQVRAEPVDFRTDIYSLGVTIFEMASGEPPYAADSAMTVMMMHINDPVPDVRSFRPDLPPALTDVINRAMAKDPDQRFQDAAELAAALRSVDKAPLGTAAVPIVAAQAPVTTVVVPPPAGSKAASPKTKSPPASVKKGAAAGEAAASDSKGENRNTILIGAVGALILLFLCIAVAAVIFGSGILSGQEDETPLAQVEPTLDNNDDIAGVGEGTVESVTTIEAAFVQQTDEAAVVQQTENASAFEQTEEAPVLQQTEQATEESLIEPTLAPTTEARATRVPPTRTAEPSPTSVPTNTPRPTEAPPTEAHPTDTPTAAPTPIAALFVLINTILRDGDSFVVDYTPQGYTPVLPGTHVHFFFNTVPPQNAGSGPTQETWFLYGGPNPFTGYKVGDRPSGATQMCSLVANPDHSIQLGTGNCRQLP